MLSKTQICKLILVFATLVAIVGQPGAEKPNGVKRPQSPSGPPSDFIRLNDVNLPFKVFQGSGIKLELFREYILLQCSSARSIGTHWPFHLFRLVHGEKVIWMTLKDACSLSSAAYADSWFWDWDVFISGEDNPTKGVIVCRLRPNYVYIGPQFLVHGTLHLHLIMSQMVPELMDFWEFDLNIECKPPLQFFWHQVNKELLDPRPPKEINPGETINLTALKWTGQLMLDASGTAKQPEKTLPRDFGLIYTMGKRGLSLDATRPHAEDTWVISSFPPARGLETGAAARPKFPSDYYVEWNHKDKRWEVYYDQYKLIREGPNKWRAEKVQK
jgi:hypothetical protein